MRMTEQQLAAYRAKRTAGKIVADAPKSNKYGAAPVEIDGRRFHSTGEGNRYLELKRLMDLGEIADLRCQVPFGLSVNGEHVGTFIADFVYHDRGGRVVEDFKSEPTKTNIYRVKKRAHARVVPH